MGVIVVVCTAFGLTASEAKTEMTFAYEVYAGVHRHIRRRGRGPGVQLNERVHILRGERQPQCHLSIEVNRRIRNAWCSLEPQVHPRAVGPTERSPRDQSGCSEPRYSRQCCTAASRGAHARVTTTRCAESTTTSSLAASVGEGTIAPTTRFPIWTRLSRREVRASR